MLNFITLLGDMRSDEQHIMQKTIARNRYPVFEKLPEFDLDLTSLKDSSLSSLICLSCPDSVEMLSSRMFFEGKISSIELS